MHLTVLTQSKKIFEGEVESFSVQTAKGRISVLPDHTNIYSILEISDLKFKNETIALNGGLLKIENNNVVIFAQEAIPSKEIIEKEVEEALEKAVHKKSATQLSSDLIEIEKEIKFAKLKKTIINSN